MKKLLLLTLVAVLAMPVYAAKKQRKTAKKAQTEATIDTRYRDASLPVEQRVEILLSQMTLNEKVGQLLCPLGWPMYEKKGNSLLNFKFCHKFYLMTVNIL